MPYQLWLADACRAWLTTEEYPGWSSRGSSSFTPGCVVCHWTAGPCRSTSRPSLGTVVDGRPGISGPLANVYLDRAGVAVVVAAGRANHAGDGGWHGLTGNSSALGIEAECCNAGDWTPEQRVAYPRLVAALLSGLGRDESWCCGHSEWAPDRKIDINDWPMPTMRQQVAELLAGAPVPAPDDEQEDDAMAYLIVYAKGGAWVVNESLAEPARLIRDADTLTNLKLTGRYREANMSVGDFDALPSE